MTEVAGESTLDPATVAVGDTGPTVEVGDLTRKDFVRYAGASGDFNPVHYDEPFAREAGYPSVFAQGMFTAGVASRFVVDWVGVETLASFSTRFAAQVWPGDSLTVEGSVAAVDRTADGTTVELEFAVRSDREDAVLTGTAAAFYPSTDRERPMD
ncbi:MaoC/PaaZ C-terminal domain-containing protein [Halomarina halobia]|uniref:MaoC/PaaZ C-terminal domain-containing protein n=1 Tax=Halomarina halobia TaxID=3033386 RepID=A0ABD6AF04_9EURY|nr:MaoC/PaaZ C-terminal domain-containing protein [Halomarina sp. PSR21]